MDVEIIEQNSFRSKLFTMTLVNCVDIGGCVTHASYVCAVGPTQIRTIGREEVNVLVLPDVIKVCRAKTEGTGSIDVFSTGCTGESGYWSTIKRENDPMYGSRRTDVSKPMSP